MASANSSARRKAPTVSGTTTGTSERALRSGPPSGKSAPRAAWAPRIFSASSPSVGMKRSAMVIIIATSCAGNRTFFSGDPPAPPHEREYPQGQKEGEPQPASMNLQESPLQDRHPLAREEDLEHD